MGGNSCTYIIKYHSENRGSVASVSEMHARMEKEEINYSGKKENMGLRDNPSDPL